MSRQIIMRIMLVAMALALLPTGEIMSMSQTAVVINANERYQEIEGFGASGAWWAQDVGGWQDANRRHVIELLFDQEKGIGLSVYRYNIGGGSQDDIIDPWRGAETFEIDRGVYDWSRDANAVWVLKAAQQAGVERFIAFANSPTGRMTISGKANGHPDGDSNLREDMVDDFAQYLVDVVRHLREDEGVPIGWISPINEPQWDWQPSKGQEGCHYTTGEILAVTRALLAALDKSGMDVHVSAPDAGEWKFAPVYVQTLFEDDPEVGARLDHFAVHSYWSELRNKLSLKDYMERKHPGVKLWMTEWTEMQEGRDYGIESALVMANVIHDDVALAGVTSWQYWIAVSKYNYRDGLIYTDEYKQDIRETKRLWAMGNYSRFVRPGYVRIGATAENADLKVSAYSAPDGSELVLVAINNSATAMPVVLSTVANRAYNTAELYETSAANDLAAIYTGDMPTEIVLAPQSITTLVIR
jgi:O-glycosyl hydrolase